MEAGPWRTRLTLSDLLAVQHTSNLRELLAYREEEGGGHQALLRGHGHGGGESLTLASALAYEKGEASSTPIPGGRTLLDIFRDDEVGPVAIAGGGGGGRTLLDIFCEDEGAVAASGEDFIWRTFEEHLRLSAAFTASSGGDRPATTGGAPLEEASGVEAADGGDEADPAGTGAEGEQPARVSLMALLEATEGQMDGGGEVWAVAEEEEEEEEEMVAGEEEQEDRRVCCVCAERRKGAAFVPCGHTFCRVCSRVLFKRRGSCPLCNAQIVQVLHIY
ncbi:putative Postreplication repair E3 ubiquitin-protein ligase RAD18 [Cocos nucifera]|nr:putative Postreplication repair E3 ubiquitin-protein ligase RAD18 [Cocos nucifera]